MSIIYVGDIHNKEKMPFKQSGILFLNWLYENYGDETIIQGGDFFDTSSHHHTFVDSLISILSKFKDFRIINGNHDQSQRLGSILLPLRNHKNITIYDDQSSIEIEGIKFIILPYKNSYKEYQNITNIDNEFEYSLNHYPPIQEAFSEEGVELKFKVNVAHIFSHIHRYREFIDNFNNKVLISGSIMDTRFGEQEWEKNIYRLNKTDYEKIKIPIFHSYETLNYGEEPINKNNILNIKNAPNRKLVYEKYKDYYIRDEGIDLLRTDITKEDHKHEFEKSSILQKFQTYAQDKVLSQEVLECCSQRLSRIV